MSFDITVQRALGDRHLAVAFQSGAGITALFGPSGVGKTSLLNMVAGVLTPDRGHIVVDGSTWFDAATGVDLPSEQRGVGYVFQDVRLFPHLRVAANLRYGARLRSGADGGMTMNEVVELLGLGSLLRRWPANLSGGEARRVAIGRALLASPRILLLDEPLVSLDEANRSAIIGAIEQLRDRLALPMLYVSHDRAEVERLASTIVEMHP